MAEETELSITIEPFRPEDRRAWQEYVRKSQTGTLFHDLDFLDYHPTGRFDFHHLILRQEGRIVGLLPGALGRRDDGVAFVSLSGASVGGMVLAADCRLHLACALVEALVRHGRQEGWSSLDLTLPPAIYNGHLAALPSYALSKAGFTLANRHVCFALGLTPRRAGGYADYFRATAANLVRGARRTGSTVASGSAALLPSFLQLLDDTYERHGTAPTHSHEDLRTLAERFPDRIRFYVTSREGEPTGGLCVFMLNPRVATTFYICTRADRAKDNGVLAALAQAIDDLTVEGYDWFDLGPSADHAQINKGVVRFKEGLGAEYHLREHWIFQLR